MDAPPRKVTVAAIATMMLCGRFNGSSLTHAASRLVHQA